MFRYGFRPIGASWYNDGRSVKLPGIYSAISFSGRWLFTGRALKTKVNDLPHALKHTPEFKITGKEIDTMNDDITMESKPNHVYARELNKTLLPPDIKRALRKSKSSASFVSDHVGDFGEKSGAMNDDRRRMKCIESTRRKEVYVSPDVSNTEEVKQVRSIEKDNIARLAHNLDKTLFSPGIHFLQDPRTRIYNFTPYLKQIVKLEEFNFEAIEEFISVSKDETLLKIAQEQNKTFYSSTSSMTSTLTQFYFLINNYDPVSVQRFDGAIFSGAVEKLPSSLIVEPKGINKGTGNTIYSIESDMSADTEILLSAMGHCLEAFLTEEKNDFDKYKVGYKNELARNSRPKNSYNYATYGNFLMRSQLDCYDERLPGNGTFDLKTRAVCAIRYDSGNPDLSGNKYQIWKMNGEIESFEREFKDLIKTGALLKYAFQARIGQMDGIFIAYHNINTFFGFQYLPLSEIDNIFYKAKKSKTNQNKLTSLDMLNDDLPSFVAEYQFKMSLDIWEDLLNRILLDLKEKSTPFRLIIKSMKSGSLGSQRLHVIAVPITQKQVGKLQSFPASSKTSFREELTQKQRYTNLVRHRKALDRFNEQLWNVNALAYHVDIEHLFGPSETPASDLHPYPHSKKQKWKIKYTISKSKPDFRRYANILSSSTKMITSAFERNMANSPKDNDKISRNIKEQRSPPEIDTRGVSSIYQLYSKIGDARAKKWEQQDLNPVVYTTEK